MILYVTKSVFNGKTLVRSLMNKRLSKFTLSGSVLDIGGGNNPSYLRFFKKDKSFSLTTVDIETGKDGLKLDLERDILPFNDSEFDDVLMMNFLEHIYNHAHIIKESARVVKTNGRLIGFVPFLVNVHPDPHDYFRYTDESLKRIFKDAGYSKVEVEPVGYGPFAVCFNTFVSIIPGKFIFWLLPIVLSLDTFLLYFKSRLKKRFPLGYLFVATK